MKSSVSPPVLAAVIACLLIVLGLVGYKVLGPSSASGGPVQVTHESIANSKMGKFRQMAKAQLPAPSVTPPVSQN